jgi:hypothetical protein
MPIPLFVQAGKTTVFGLCEQLGCHGSRNIQGKEEEWPVLSRTAYSYVLLPYVATKNVATSHKICGYPCFVASFLWLVATFFGVL